MNKLLITLLTLALPLSAEAREFECFGLKEAPENNPKLRFAVTIDYQKIGTVYEYAAYLKEEDGVTYLYLRSQTLPDLITYARSSQIDLTVIEKITDPSLPFDALHHVVSCEPTGAL